MERFIGIDLAWSEGSAARRAGETGVAVIDPGGRVLDCGWTCGVEETLAWLGTAVAGAQSALAFVDAPLIVDNDRGQRLCERQVGQRYGRWKVSANSTNLASPRLAGVTLRARLEQLGWTYDDGLGGPRTCGRVVSECYPYTCLVGARELGYDTARPTYKRQPRGVPRAEWRAVRAAACDDLVRRLAALGSADPPLLLASHPTSRRLLDEGSPIPDADYKHREDLVDALICAWTAALWAGHGFARCQVLGPPAGDPSVPAATIIAPARAGQRRGRTAGTVAEGAVSLKGPGAGEAQRKP